MSEALMRAEPEPKALVVPERKSGSPSEAAPTPPAAAQVAEGTTYGPHDRVPQADAEEEC